MQPRIWITSSLGILVLVGTALSQFNAPRTERDEAIRGFQLVAPRTGWVLTGNHLFLTTDGGSSWRDKTPPLGGSSHLEGASFGDRQHGWVVTRNQDLPAVLAIQVAITKDSGDSWHFSELRLPAADASNYAGVSSISVVDEHHVWVLFRRGSSSNFSFGSLAMTEDGGESWKMMPYPPIAGSVFFTTNLQGWIAGGAAGEQLWQTNDGGLSWRQITVSNPDACINCRPVYQTPIYRDSGLFLLVRFEGDDIAYASTFRSEDNGASWTLVRSQRAESRSLVVSGRSRNSSAAAMLIEAPDHSLSIRSRSRQSLAELPQRLWSSGNFARADFLDDAEGWLLWGAGRCSEFKQQCIEQTELLATVDAGTTVHRITPPAITQQFETSKHISSDDSLRTGSTPTLPGFVGATTALSGTLTSTKLGFDKACVGTTSFMQTWWQASPYWDTGVYLGGCNVTCVPPNGPNACGGFAASQGRKTTNSNFTPTWASTASAEGWGLAPLWVGPQAPCISNPSGFYVIMDPTSPNPPASAYAEGVAEADAAITQAAWLGISNGIIYYDMEYYGPNASCSSSVASFLSGWVAELKNRGFLSGVYMNNSNVADLKAVSPAPDAVWIAKWDAVASTDDSALPALAGLWTNDQRIHQYCDTTRVSCGTNTWGGTADITIDGNADDAPVVSWGGDRAKSTTIPPLVTSFTVDSNSITAGTALHFTAVGADIGGPGLSWAELWKAPDLGGAPGTWNMVNRTSVSGTASVGVSFTDTPTVGTYWYGTHYVDINGLYGVEPQKQQVTVVPSTFQPQNGWWWDPKLSGTGFFFEENGASGTGVFLGAFVYDPAGNATWLVSTGDTGGAATYSGDWLKVTGGQTLLGPYKTPSSQVVGKVSVAFSDSSHAVMTRPDGTQINLQRFSFTASPTPAPPLAGTPQGGWWWAGPAMSGTGFGIEFQGSSVFIVAFVYDDAGNPVWYLATGSLTTPMSYSGTWDLYAGGPQLTSPEGSYSAHKVNFLTPVNITFTDATHGTITMGSVSIPITRFQSFGNAPPPPTIAGFNPTSGTPGVGVTISGTNFNPVASNNTVKFNGVTATVTSATTSTIATSVPNGATTGPITVTTSSGTATSPSNFTITTSQPGTISLGQTVSGNLTANSPSAKCLNGPADRWTFVLTASSTVTIDATSSAFQVAVCLMNSSLQGVRWDYGSGIGTNSRIIYQNLPVGTYYIEVSSYSNGNVGGAYGLSVQPGLPPGVPINIGQTLSGTLSGTTAAKSVCLNGPADRWTMVVTSSTTVTIDATSSAFQVAVCLLNSSNQSVRWDYGSGVGTNSRIVYQGLAVGTYYIEVASYSNGNAGGAYNLAVQQGLPPGAAISIGQSLGGNLSATTAAKSVCMNGPADRWAFSVSTSTTITIDATSSAFQVSVCLLNSTNQSLRWDYGSGTGTNSRLIYQNLPVGTYYIEVASYSSGNSGGAYNLSLQSGLPPGMPIALGQTASGSLSLNTAAKGSCISGPADRWQFSLTGTATLTISGNSTAFQTVVCLLNSTNQSLKWDYGSGSGSSGFTSQNVAPGVYYIEVGSNSSGHAGGAYTVTLKAQ